MRRIAFALLAILALTILVACDTRAQAAGTVTALPGQISGWTINPSSLQQTPETPAKPAVAQPTAEQKAQLTALARQWEQKAREADAAKDKYMIQLLATLAELGLKPSETSVSWNEKGEPVFNRIEQAKAPTPKPEAKP